MIEVKCGNINWPIWYWFASNCVVQSNVIAFELCQINCATMGKSQTNQIDFVDFIWSNLGRYQPVCLKRINNSVFLQAWKPWETRSAAAILYYYYSNCRSFLAKGAAFGADTPNSQGAWLTGKYAILGWVAELESIETNVQFASIDLCAHSHSPAVIAVQSIRKHFSCGVLVLSKASFTVRHALTMFSYGGNRLPLCLPLLIVTGST